MLVPTVPNDVAQKVIRIPGTEIIPRIQPAIAVGEVLRMVVRQNDQGQGQLYFRGLLIPATLPETLAPGDKIFAKVTEANNQLVLKLLETQKGGGAERAPSPSGAAVQDPIIRELETLVKNSVPLLKGAPPLTVPQAPSPGVPASAKGPAPAPDPASEVLTKALLQLTDSVATSETFSDPKQAMNQLLEATTGKVAGSLRETAERIRTLLGEPGTPQGRFLSALRGELSRYIEGSVTNNHESKRQLESLITSLTEELKVTKKAGGKERELLRATLQDLHSAKESPEKAPHQLESTLKKLHDAYGHTVRVPLDPRTQTELQQIAGRLEQMAASQENLNQLNPVMQALGEPALILFPFLAQGLLSHSEVSIESHMEGGDGKNSGRQDSDDDEGSPDTTPYQRIQVSVPLPSLGTVHVDIAHRKDEILVRFSVSEADASSFLLQQLEHLGTTLRSLNFQKTELMTHVGTKAESAPSWVLASSGSRTVIA